MEKKILLAGAVMTLLLITGTGFATATGNVENRVQPPKETFVEPWNPTKDRLKMLSTEEILKLAEKNETIKEMVKKVKKLVSYKSKVWRI